MICWLVVFYGLSTFVTYLIPNPVNIYMICWLVVFYGISTFVGYLILNPAYTYILKIRVLLVVCIL